MGLVSISLEMASHTHKHAQEFSVVFCETHASYFDHRTVRDIQDFLEEGIPLASECPENTGVVREIQSSLDMPIYKKVFSSHVLLVRENGHINTRFVMVRDTGHRMVYEQYMFVVPWAILEEYTKKYWPLRFTSTNIEPQDHMESLFCTALRV